MTRVWRRAKPVRARYLIRPAETSGFNGVAPTPLGEHCVAFRVAECSVRNARQTARELIVLEQGACYICYITSSGRRRILDVVITEWGLQSYLDLVGRQNVFGKNYYQSTIRPDVELLKQYPNPTKFQNGKFWSRVSDVAKGYKMKWHNVGPGNVQLRLPVLLHDDEAFLCEAYVKKGPKQEKRRLRKFKVRASLIRQNRYKRRGVLP